MTYNMAGGEWGWEHGPGSQQTATDEQGVVDAIRAARADVVGLQEPFGRTRLIARMLGPGWYAYPRLHTVSRYPILEPGGAKSVYAYIQIAPGRVVAVLNTHLPSAPYGPYGVRDGKGLARVLHNENVSRIPWMKPILAAARPLITAGVPTILTGDFNSPSWRDWTPAVVHARGLPYSVRWPVSLAIEQAGFRDTYRHASPQRDQVARIHLAQRVAAVPTPRQVFRPDRHRLGRRPRQGAAIPDRRLPRLAVYRHPGQTWVSDHRAVVTTLRVHPVDAAQPGRRRLVPGHRGDSIGVSFRAPDATACASSCAAAA